MEATVDQIVDTYRNVARIPVAVSASILPIEKSRYKLRSVWQQRDLERSENIKFSNTDIIEYDESTLQNLGCFTSTELKKELLSSFSHCGRKRAVIREVLTKDSEKIQYLEVWNNGRKSINVNLKDAKKHDKVISDDQFGALSWSQSDHKILYIAEKKLPKTCSFFKFDIKDDEKPGNEHLWQESWGEQLTDAHQPTLCVFDLETEKISTYTDAIPKDLSVGQAVWFNSDNFIICVGWKHIPYRLGLRYCPIRESVLFLLNISNGETRLISSENMSVRSPRVHPNENKIFYLENRVGGPHMQCSKLMVVEILEKSDPQPKMSVVVDEVKLPKSIDDFHGIYAMNMPTNCFSADGRHIFMTTSYRSHTIVIAIDTTTGNVENATKHGSCIVLDVCNDIIVASRSSPTMPPQIVLGKYVPGKQLLWNIISEPCKEITNISWSVHQYIPDYPNADFPNVGAEYILHKPCKDRCNNALIVTPHGGPHSVIPTAFMHSISTMCQLGFTVVQINYRGSTGFGQDGINCLPGRVGTQDVADVQQVANLVKSQENFEKVYVTGGSHGGFLTLHLIGQYPDFYKAASVRNPVIDMTSMCTITDIPDWNYCEGLMQDFSHDVIPSSHDYGVMLSKSPISVIKNAKAPCLLMIGDCDLRVPPSQGLHWAKKIQSSWEEL